MPAQHACPQPPKKEAAPSPQKERHLKIGSGEPLQLRTPEMAVCSLTSKLDKGECPVKHQRELHKTQHACPSPQKERHLKISPGEPLELNLLEMAVCILTSKLDKGECSVKRQRELQKT